MQRNLRSATKRARLISKQVGELLRESAPSERWSLISGALGARGRVDASTAAPVHRAALIIPSLSHSSRQACDSNYRRTSMCCVQTGRAMAARAATLTLVFHTRTADLLPLVHLNASTYK